MPDIVYHKVIVNAPGLVTSYVLYLKLSYLSFFDLVCRYVSYRYASFSSCSASLIHSQADRFVCAETQIQFRA